jgi:hypothetical protein
VSRLWPSSCPFSKKGCSVFVAQLLKNDSRGTDAKTKPPGKNDSVDEVGHLNLASEDF